MSGMFPHTVSLYNVSVERQPDYTDRVTNHITILRGVFLEARKGVNVLQSGLENADSGTLYIPKNIKAVDGETGEPKQYLSPMDFWRLEDKTGYWTLTVSASGTVDGSTFLVKGEVVEPEMEVEKLEALYENVHNITKIDDMDYGGGMEHWELGVV